MAIAVYRYVWRGVTVEGITNNIAAGINVDLTHADPDETVDISIDPAGATVKEDLDSYMRSIGWEPLATDPTSVPPTRMLLSAQTVGVGPVVLLNDAGTEFIAENGKSYIFKISVIGARLDTPDIALSQYFTATGHASGGNLVLDGPASGLTGSNQVTLSTPGGLVLRAEVTGVVGTTYNWTVEYEILSAIGAP